MNLKIILMIHKYRMIFKIYQLMNQLFYQLMNQLMNQLINQLMNK